MAKERKRDDVYHKCFDDFIQGIELTEIAQRNNVNLRTLKNWHEYDEWQNHREIVLATYAETYYEKVVDYAEKIVDNLMSSSLELSEMVKEYTLELSKQKQKVFKNFDVGDGNQDAERKKFRNEIFDLADIQHKISQVMHNSLPSANEEMSRKMITCLETKIAKAQTKTVLEVSDDGQVKIEG